jgi:hypothetical protein
MKQTSPAATLSKQKKNSVTTLVFSIHHTIKQTTQFIGCFINKIHSEKPSYSNTINW